jgi:hypothetical protein
MQICGNRINAKTGTNEGSILDRSSFLLVMLSACMLSLLYLARCISLSESLLFSKCHKSVKESDENNQKLNHFFGVASIIVKNY